MSIIIPQKKPGNTRDCYRKKLENWLRIVNNVRIKKEKRGQVPFSFLKQREKSKKGT